MWTSAWQAVLCLKEVKVQEGFQVPEIWPHTYSDCSFCTNI
jgi:hypothetical protein